MKRMLAILLTALLLTALLPATAFAETTNYVDSGRVTLPNPGRLLMELGQNTQAAPLHKVSVYDIGSIFMDTGTSKRVVELCVSLPSIANADSITGFNTENIYTNTNTGNKFASFEFAFTDAELEAEAITGSRKIDWKDASGAVLYTEYLNYEIWLDTSGGFSGVSRVPKSRVTVSVNDALTSNADGKNVTWAFKDDKLVFTIGDIPAERWQRAYAELGSGATVILADIRIAAPSADCKYVKDIQGNMNYAAFQNNMNDKNNFRSYDDNQKSGNGIDFAQVVALPEGRYQIIPSAGTRNRYIGWRKQGDGSNVGDLEQTEMLEMEIKVASGVEPATIKSPFSAIPSSRIVIDSTDFITGFTGSYDEQTKTVKYLFTNGLESIKAACAGQSKSTRTRIYAPNANVDSCKMGNYSLSLKSDVNGKYIEFSRTYIDHGEPKTMQEAVSLLWKDNAGNETIEGFTYSVAFQDEVLWPDGTWKKMPAPTQDRPMGIAIGQNTVGTLGADPNSYTNILGSGLNVSIANGKIVSSIPSGTTPDIPAILHAELMINGPTGAVAYKMNSSGGTGGIGYNTSRANEQDAMINQSTVFRSNQIRRPLHKCRSFTVGGITLWYAADLGSADVVIIDWYKHKEGTDDDLELLEREYFTFSMEPFYQQTKTAVASSEEAIVAGDKPVMTAAGVTSGNLVCTTYPQEGRSDARYFELTFEGAQQTIEGEDRVIYLPYSFIKWTTIIKQDTLGTKVI